MSDTTTPPETPGAVPRPNTRPGRGVQHQRDEKIAALITALAFKGNTDHDIAFEVDMAEKTMQRNYRKELTRGRVRRRVKMRDAIHDKVMGTYDEQGNQLTAPDNVMLTFAAKAELGMAETIRHQHQQLPEIAIQ